MRFFQYLSVLVFIWTLKPCDSLAQLYDPGPGKTYLLIGQTWKDEFTDYISGTAKPPAGSSHYGELYSGTFNQGDDASNNAYLDWVSRTYPKAYVELAISIKDNPAAGGYTGPNAVWKACTDVVAGKWDEKIDMFIATLKKYPSLRFLLRIGYEVSIPLFANKTTTDIGTILDKYNSQGINPIENAPTIEEFDLEAYKSAYNHIADKMKAAELPNIAYVYHPVRGICDAKFLYPGNQNVDWIGVSTFNHDVCLSTLENGVEMFNCPETEQLDANLDLAMKWAKDSCNKPLMIAESAVQQPACNTVAGFKNYIDRLAYIIETYDVRCLAYINSDWILHHWTPPWGDSRVEKEAEVKSHWLDEVNKTRYLHYDDVSANSPSNHVFKKQSISILPSSNSKKELILTGAHPNTLYELYTLSGKLIKIGKGKSINLSGLSYGVYLLKTNLQYKANFINLM